MTMLFVDAMMVILLLFGIRSVMKFQEDMKDYKTLKDDLSKLLRELHMGMKSAEKTIQSLQESIKFASKNVTPYLPKANSLRDDLSFLLERGEKVADHLENLCRDIKKYQLTPQTVVFDPEKAQEGEKYEKKEEKKDDDDVEKDYKGFFTTIRRVS